MRSRTHCELVPFPTLSVANATKNHTKLPFIDRKQQRANKRYTPITSPAGVQSVRQQTVIPCVLSSQQIGHACKLGTLSKPRSKHSRESRGGLCSCLSALHVQRLMPFALLCRRKPALRFVWSACWTCGTWELGVDGEG